MSNSDSYYQLNLKYTPCGTQTLSKMPDKFVEGIYPKMLEKGLNGHVWDYDGNEYIDLISGLGAISIGYADVRVNDAAYMQMLKGASFSLPTALEYLVAKKLTELVRYTDQWKFFKTGSEATSAAVRLARAVTKRENILTCGYHGWHDWYAILNDRKAGIPKVLNEYVKKAEYNNISSFSPLNTREYAALIMEPMVFAYPNEGFLEEIKDLCQNTGTLLIFDEVVTGGRFSKFTAQEEFNIYPDITVLSKGIGNGFPIAAVGARKEISRVFEADNFFASGTFGGETVSLAACLKTLSILNEELPQMIEKGILIQNAFNKKFKNYGECKGYPTRLTFDFKDLYVKALFMQEMCKHGVLTGYSNMIMATHSINDIDWIIGAFNDIDLENTKLEGKLPTQALRLR